MRRTIFLLVFSFTQIHAQTTQPMVVSYDIDLADTTIDGLRENNIPFFLPKTLSFIQQTWNDIEKGKYECYYRCSLTKAEKSFTFPLLTKQTYLETLPYPPYDEVEKVLMGNIELKYIEKLRIYELWTVDQLKLDNSGYQKTTIAFSFILRPEYGGCSNEYNIYADVADILVCKKANQEAKVNPRENFEPYIFLLNPQYLATLKEKLQ